MKNNSQIWSVWDSGRFFGTNKSNGYVTVEKEWALRTLGLSNNTTTWPTPDRVGPWRYFQDRNGTSIVTTPASGTNAVSKISFNLAGGWDADVNNFYITVSPGGEPVDFTYAWDDPISTLQSQIDSYYGAGKITASKINNPGTEQSISFSYDWATYLGYFAALPLIMGSFGGSTLPAPPYYTQTSTDGTYTAADYTSLETEVPNVKSVSIDRSIDTDAASCTIVLYNSSPSTDYGESNWAQPGYYSYNRGNSAEALARWGDQVNDWNNVLVPMALLRTYEGFGGYYDDGTRADYATAVEVGAVTITGTWFVDSVSVGTDGLLTLKCRDAAKLLIEQLLYPPLIPQSQAPLKYFRWKDSTYTAIWDPGAGLGPRGASAIPISFASSSQDTLKGNIAFGFAISPYANVLGTTGGEAADGGETTYSVGHGWGSANGDEVVDWWDFTVNAQINRVYVSPWGGGYTCYISVIEGGVWQTDGGVVPYVAGSIAPGDTVADSGAAIPFVVSSGVSFESPVTIELPRIYNAQRIRISFRDHKLRGGFPTNADTAYRSGLREVAVGLSNLTSQPWTFALAREYRNGYWAIAANGQIFPFGQATDQLTDANPGISSEIVAAEGHPTQSGFYALERNGKVHAYSAAGNTVGYYSDAAGEGATDFIDIAVTNTGQGYWLLRSSGGVYTYGDAAYMSGTFNGSGTLGELPASTDPTKPTATAIAGHPTTMGYWITDGLGRVGNFGDATNYGEVTPPRPASGVPAAIEPTSDGAGYWILWGNGQVFNYGNATNAGQFIGGSFSAAGYPGIWWDFVRTNTPLAGSPQGYWGLRADGFIGAWGANHFGSPGSSTATTRTDGNYLDYAEIIKDLLGWSGFTLSEFGGYDQPVAVGIHGTVESTGVYSEEVLSEDIFDKKPVIEAIRTFAEIVGYITWVDEEGGFHFVAPNWWAPGNFYEDGTRVSFIPEVDEEKQLFDYSMNFSDDSLRSEIIITNQLPTPQNNNTITNRYIPPGQNLLRGMVRPAIWSNEVFNRPEEQQIMAELIGLHIWFSQREGNTTCVANPCIQINDQVRIWERTSAESYIHYVRGISTQHDFDTGEYTMSLTTHWLGSESSWVISTSNSATSQNDYIGISQGLVTFLENTGSEAANPAYFSGFTGGI